MPRHGSSQTAGRGTLSGNSPSPCRFGAGRLKIRIRAFLAEIDGVRAGTDPEAIHRMRVASRRLRSTLPVFSFCFRKQQYRLFEKGFKGIMRALGEARDTDVQIMFLSEYLPGLLEGSEEANGVRVILALLDTHRKREQQRILSALDVLESERVLPAFRRAVEEVAGGGGAKGRKKRSPGSMEEMAAAHIRTVLGEVLSYDPAVHDPSDVPGHHALRIATKRLRYTLEIFRPLYPDRLRPAIDGLKRLQELLGQIHDCDVWITHLSGPVEGGPLRELFHEAEPESGSLRANENAGIAGLLSNRKATRSDLYRQLVTEWDGPVTGSLAERLRPALHPAAAEQGAPSGKNHKTGREKPADNLGALGGLFPEGEGHARQVTHLALRLFDELIPLHGYSGKERRLLEYAGFLHDIGWVHGQKGHHTRSCRMILSDHTLPVTRRERAAIALIARNHRKTVAENPGRAARSLKPEDLRRVLSLSAILRIADGLDYTHSGCITSLSCTVGPASVTCTVRSRGDAGTERARALEKADLFERVFERRFEIA